MNSVSEQIDERILRLLGLEDIFDLDYDTYYTLIREAMVVGKDKIPQEELALLANERKRIKGKEGRFKPKKITTDKIATTKFLIPAKRLTLPAPISKQDEQGALSIGKPLESISKTLAALLKFEKKTNEEERKDKESEKRSKREEGLEGFKKGISAISGVVKKTLAPFQSIIDRIWKFIFFTLLGRAFTQLMDWLGNPANKKKIDVLGRFLKDWWPTLLGAAVLFFTPFGGFVRKTLSLVGFFAGKLVKAIPQIANAVKGLGQFALFNPVGQTITAATIGGAAGAYTESKLREVDETLLQRRIKESKEKGTPLSSQEIEKIKIENLQKRVATVTGQNAPAALAAGGSVPNLGFGYDGIDGSTGQKVSGFGPDTQMIAAQPGEIVINKKTVEAVGSEHFLALNRQYGGPGANKPKYKNNTTSASTGGIIPAFRNGGMVGGGAVPNFKFGSNRIYNNSEQKVGLDAQIIASGMVKKYQNGGMVKQNKASTPKPPKINSADYNTLLAISAIEDTNPQGRADVAQSIYNRLFASQKYGMNFNQSANTVKNLITAGGGRDTGGQYEPTFNNKADWINITDKRSAAIALINSKKGKDNKWTLKDAMNQLNATELALKNPTLQSQAQKHVGGRTYFLGTSQQGNMKPGDVLRDPKQNFFSPWYTEGTSYDKERRNIASPIPEMLLPKKPNGNQKPRSQQSSIIEKFRQVTNTIGNIGNKIFGKKPIKKQGGGSIGEVKENTGYDIQGATNDRQLVALKPFEYVLPVDTVAHVGKENLDSLVARTDHKSNPAVKLGKRNINRPQITPLRRGQGGVITLPPITQSASAGVGNGIAAGSKVPSFSASSPSGGADKNWIASLYGIVG